MLANVTIVETGDIAANVARTGCISYGGECYSLFGYPRAFEEACRVLSCDSRRNGGRPFTAASQLALETNWRNASASPSNASDWLSFPTPTCPGVVAWRGDEPKFECCLSSQDYKGRDDYIDGFEDGHGDCMRKRCAD